MSMLLNLMGSRLLSLSLANQKRQELIKQAAEVDDEIAELFLDNVLSFNAQLVLAI